MKKITVLYGKENQGKSSLLQLGILPFLEKNSLSTQWTHIVIDNYFSWIENIGNFLFYILKKEHPLTLIKPLLINTIEEIKKLIEEINMNIDENNKYLIIFDQLEHFFQLNFNNNHKKKVFAQLINYLTEANNFKIILSIQTSYLSYLIELNNLNKFFELEDLYQLNDINHQELKEGWQTLYQEFDFPFTPKLIKVVFDDLIQESKYIKPLELQIVMSQLEKKGIFTLEDYYQSFNHPQESRLFNIFKYFLLSIIKYFKNTEPELAQTILYCLIEQQNKSIVAKSIRELIKDLKLMNYSFKIKHIEIILDILVESNLVLCILTPSDTKYQLLHPILIKYISQNFKPKVI